MSNKPTATAELKGPGEDNPLQIDLDAFARDILEGDAEWFERIAERELQKPNSIRSTPA